jgi:tyrosine-specific transport protein
MNFLHDLFTGIFCDSDKTLSAAVKFAAFLPPALIAVFYPAVFIKALDVVGGVGIVTLFGILPCMIVLCKKSYSPKFRLAGAFFLLFALAALLTAIATLSGVKADLVPECQKNHGKIKFSTTRNIDL